MPILVRLYIDSKKEYTHTLRVVYVPRTGELIRIGDSLLRVREVIYEASSLTFNLITLECSEV